MGLEPDTGMGGRGGRFPSTRRSVILAAGAGDWEVRREALGAVIEAYWKPVYKYIRLQWRKSNEEAKDLAQGFFASLLERGLVGRYDENRASFRTYLRTCVDGYVMHEAESEGRLKRGGGQEFVALDFESAEQEMRIRPAGPRESMEDFFYREWQRQMFALAVEDLRRQCEAAGKQVHFRLFEQYDLADSPAGERPTYEQLGAEHGIPATSVTNYLAWARRELRRLLLERLGEITAGATDFQREARSLLGPAR